MTGAVWGRRIAITLVIVALWEAMFRSGLLNPLIFGSPSLVLGRYDRWRELPRGFPGDIEGDFGRNCGRLDRRRPVRSVGRYCSVAGPRCRAAYVCGDRTASGRALSRVVASLGIGEMSKIVYGAAGGFFPVALATVIGIRAIDPRYVEMSRAMGASRAQIVFQVELLALPAIVSGLRVGTALAIISVIQSEMLASTDGLGFWISYHRSLFNVGQVYLGIILVLVTAAISNVLLSLLENRLGSWRALEQASM